VGPAGCRHEVLHPLSANQPTWMYGAGHGGLPRPQRIWRSSYEAASVALFSVSCMLIGLGSSTIPVNGEEEGASDPGLTPGEPGFVPVETEVEIDPAGPPSDMTGWQVVHWGGDGTDSRWQTESLDASSSYNRDATNFMPASSYGGARWTCSSHIGPSSRRPAQNKVAASLWMACEGAVVRYFMNTQFLYNRFGFWHRYSNPRETTRCTSRECVWVAKAACYNNGSAAHYFMNEGYGFARLTNGDLVNSEKLEGTRSLYRHRCTGSP
jgi:hypothetical protein